MEIKNKQHCVFINYDFRWVTNKKDSEVRIVMYIIYIKGKFHFLLELLSNKLSNQNGFFGRNKKVTVFPFLGNNQCKDFKIKKCNSENRTINLLDALSEKKIKLLSAIKQRN